MREMKITNKYFVLNNSGHVSGRARKYSSLRMSKFEIKHRYNNSILFSIEIGSMKLAIEAALAAKIDLSYADVGSADLRSANLRSANLGSANLRYANLGSANLRYANLRSANLRSANLGSANLRYANLSYANLGSANLRSANLNHADLSHANLRSANLSYADLGSADLSHADLGSTNLFSADLRSANLGSADLGSTKLREAQNLILPTGETWKEYLEETVPALLKAGGKTLESFVPHWTCHEWNNCPIAHAFNVHGLSTVPLLLRPRAEQFIMFFDAKQIPISVLGGKCAAKEN